MRNLIKILIVSVFCSGCSITYIEVEKHVYIDWKENLVEVTGSDLEGNSAQQSSAFDWFLEIPFLK